MKISKNLLQAILIGATLGTAVSSCSLVRENSEIVQEQIEEGEEKCDIDDLGKAGMNCPACGLG